MVNVKLPLGLIREVPGHEDVSGSLDIAPTFLTSALDGGKWSMSRRSRFTPGKRSPLPIVEETVWAPEYILNNQWDTKGKGW
jgi:hypothetical protein